jgi:hypothetical protein
MTYANGYDQGMETENSQNRGSLFEKYIRLSHVLARMREAMVVKRSRTFTGAGEGRGGRC